jgi:hypothetical protein
MVTIGVMLLVRIKVPLQPLWPEVGSRIIRAFTEDNVKVVGEQINEPSYCTVLYQDVCYMYEITYVFGNEWNGQIGDIVKVIKSLGILCLAICSGKS